MFVCAASHPNCVAVCRRIDAALRRAHSAPPRLLPPSLSPPRAFSPLPPPRSLWFRSTHNSRKCGRPVAAQTAQRRPSGRPSSPSRCWRRRSQSSSASDTTPPRGGATRQSAPRRRRVGRSRLNLSIYTSSKSPTLRPASFLRGRSIFARSSMNSFRTRSGAWTSHSLPPFSSPSPIWSLGARLTRARG